DPGTERRDRRVRPDPLVAVVRALAAKHEGSWLLGEGDVEVLVPHLDPPRESRFPAQGQPVVVGPGPERRAVCQHQGQLAAAAAHGGALAKGSRDRLADLPALDAAGPA